MYSFDTNNTLATSQSQDYNVLKDVRKSGKSNDWKGKKLSNEQYAELLEILNYKKHTRVSECANVLTFKKTKDNRLSLHQAWFCKSRMCPLCNWRRSIIHSYNITRIIDECNKRQPKGRWLFVTLTEKNVSTAKELSDSLTRMNRAYVKLIARKKLATNLLGTMKAIEVTYNEKDKSYNQHMHALFFVKSTYMKKGHYISQKELTEMWQKSMKLDYVPIVNMKAAKDNVAYEMGKYPVKSADYLSKKITEEERSRVLDDLEKGLHGKRLISFTGLLKEIHKELNLTDTENENADLINENQTEDTTEEMVIASWDTSRKNYFIQ